MKPSLPQNPWMSVWKRYVECNLSKPLDSNSLLFQLSLRTLYSGLARTIINPRNQYYMPNSEDILGDLTTFMKLHPLTSSEPTEIGKIIQDERKIVRISGMGWKNHLAHERGELDEHVNSDGHGFKPWKPITSINEQELKEETNFLNDRYKKLKESKFHDLLLEANRAGTSFWMAETDNLRKARQWGYWIEKNKEQIQKDTGGVNIFLNYSTDGYKPEIGLVQFDWWNDTFCKK